MTSRLQGGEKIHFWCSSHLVHGILFCKTRLTKMSFCSSSGKSLPPAATTPDFSLDDEEKRRGFFLNIHQPAGRTLAGRMGITEFWTDFRNLSSSLRLIRCGVVGAPRKKNENKKQSQESTKLNTLVEFQRVFWRLDQVTVYRCWKDCSVPGLGANGHLCLRDLPFFSRETEASPPEWGGSCFSASKKHRQGRIYPNYLHTEHGVRAWRRDENASGRHHRVKTERSLAGTYEEFMDILAAAPSFSQNPCKRGMHNWKTKTISFSERVEAGSPPAVGCRHTAAPGQHLLWLFTLSSMGYFSPK